MRDLFVRTDLIAAIGHCAVTVLLLGITLFGCDASFTRPDPETPDALAVTSILDPLAPEQGVLLTTVASPLPDRENSHIVDGATVRIDGVDLENRPASDSLRTPSDLLQEANYRTERLEIEPGATYKLTVEKGAHEISGTVAVPDTFTGRAEGRRLVWTASDDAARYRVLIEDAANTSFAFSQESTVSDTSVLVGSESETLTPGRYYVEVHAQDSNLVRFLHDETDRAGVKGGYGLFGARTTISGTVEFPGKAGSTAAARGLSISN